LAALGATILLAAAPAGLDAVPIGITPPISIGGDAPASVEQRPRGNPLWGIPLSVLSATRERPLFLPARRPVAPVLAAPQAAPPSVAVAAEPEQPRLALVGAIVRDGEQEAIAIFVDQASNSVVRLRIGQKHGEWMLNSVKGRSATFQKGGETLVIELPAPGAALPVAAPVLPAAIGAPAHADPARPGALVTPDASLGAPYVPRSPPKNGESDGL
jgi:general secretion pathway protein N